ncbi:MAG: GNAT family N-acetyltransferase [Candidatus Aminicenantes bacterium]|nr:GNAT family N-acetyltransferase [Candidatus Aminicenantes bacterium]
MMVREAKPEDCQVVNGMMADLIDEIYAAEGEEVRRGLKANFTNEALKELCGDEQARTYVVEVDGEVVAFLFGWLFHRVFTLYWIYCRKKHRARGVVKALLVRLEGDLRTAGCYKVEMYAYAEHNRFLDFSERLGFRKGVLLEKTMFGFEIQNLYKYLRDPATVDTERTIKIIGEAGQGVKLLSYTLASILAQLGHEVSLSLEYDAAVRGGTISADLIYSERPIENPTIEEADVLIKFTRNREWFPAKALVIDESFCDTESLTCSIQSRKGTSYGFENVAVTLFGSKVFINMIALGRILRYIGVNILLLNIADLLPKRSLEKNLEAVKYGYNFRDAH